jgi:hypothetical protein
MLSLATPNGLMCDAHMQLWKSMYERATTTPVCEHCNGKAAHDGTRYCKECASKLEKDLGLDDEEEAKNADGAGGSAESSAAPGVSVEHTSAAGQQTAEPCIDCQKQPATRGDRCGSCVAAKLAKIKEEAEEKEKLNAIAVEAYRAEIEQCKTCKPIRPGGGCYDFCCGMHLQKICYFSATAKFMFLDAADGLASGTLTLEVLLEQMTLNAPAVVASELAGHIKKCARCATAGEKRYCDTHRDMVDARLKVQIAKIGAAFGGQVFKLATPAAAVESPPADGNGAVGAGGAMPLAAPDGSVEQGAAAASQTAPGCPECKGPATDGQVCAACVPKVLEAIKTQKEVERMKRDVTHATLDEFDKKTKYCGPCRSVRKCARQYCEDCNGWL